VRVRVLADAYGSLDHEAGVLAGDAEPKNRGAAVSSFWSHLRGSLFRDHRKIIASTAGFLHPRMNVANEYGSSRHNKDASWRDTHMRVEGPDRLGNGARLQRRLGTFGRERLFICHPSLRRTRAAPERWCWIHAPAVDTAGNGRSAGGARCGVTKTPLDYEFLFCPEPDGDPPPGAGGLSGGVDVRLLLQGAPTCPWCATPGMAISPTCSRRGAYL